VFSRGYRRYVLFALTLVYTLNCLDQGLIILLLQPIKEDLRLSDSQLGFLTGIAFGLFYATLGVPIARWADRGNRASIASMAIGLWGVTVMLCLFVTSFLQLVAARIAAGIGESGGMPPTYSLLGDYFPKAAERTRAMAIYMLASPLSLLVSFIVGGWVNERFGWRVAFFVMGVPGLLVGALVKLTVRDPRAEATVAGGRVRTQPAMRAVMGTLWRQRSSRHLIIAFILLYTMGLGLSPWYAAFMIRTHGMGTAELGVWLGLIFGVSGVAGTLLGGYVMARWFGADAGAQMRLSAMVVALLVPCYVLFLLLPQKGEALIALTPTIILGNFISGPAFALIQRLVSDEIRATTLALVMLFANLIGMGVGPQAVGVLSDWLLPRMGADSLRYAMLAMSSVALWSAYHFWQVGRTVREDLDANAAGYT
jgi:predicted MFS family arabinose efflux permease